MYTFGKAYQTVHLKWVKYYANYISIKLVKKSKQTMPFHFIIVVQFCRSMHTEGIRMGIH